MFGPRAAVPAALLVVFVIVAVAAVVGATPQQPAAISDAPAPQNTALPRPTPGPTTLPTDGLPGALTRSTSGGGATVAVAWLTAEYLKGSPAAALGLDAQRYLIFVVVVDAPSLKMSASDLRGMIYLRDGGGKEYGSPTWLPTRDGSRKAGIAAFPSADARGKPVPSLGSRFIEIVIRDLSGLPERSLRWNL